MGERWYVRAGAMCARLATRLVLAVERCADALDDIAGTLDAMDTREHEVRQASQRAMEAANNCVVGFVSYRKCDECGAETGAYHQRPKHGGF